jgi:hypothetical protein
MRDLAPCARCRRHIPAGAACPFCARRAAGLAIIVAASVATVSCSSENQPTPEAPTDSRTAAPADSAAPTSTVAEPAPTSTVAEPAPTSTVAEPAPTAPATATSSVAPKPTSPTTYPDRPRPKYGITQPRPHNKYGMSRPNF